MVKFLPFYKKCDGNVQQLILIKNVKVETFGGFTKRGFNSKEDDLKDEKAFLFSLTVKKII